MRKLFTKIGIVLLVTSSVSPLVACSFNFYINRAANAIARSFANQTSSVLKSLVMSKTVDSDTGSTNDDIMSQTKNSSIVNATNGQNLNNWHDFANKWGNNGTIDINGFDPNTYFKSTGTGSLTKSVNTRRTLTNGLHTASQIRLLSALTNPTLYNLAIAPTGIAHGPIVEFIKTLQGDLATKPGLSQLIINLINNYGTDFIPEITRLMGNLVNGEWEPGQQTPANVTELTTFMSGWKDKNNQPYSAWNNGTTWSIPKPLVVPQYQGRPVDTWVSKEDYDLYRGGTLINYLFWKMSSDNNIYKPGTTTGDFRYFGGIMSQYITLDSSFNPHFDDVGFGEDAKQYLPYILTNPIYPLLLIEGIIPIIKKWFLEMPDITLGVKHLTVGDIATDQSTQSFNLLDVANTIKYLVNNPEQLKTIIRRILGGSSSSALGYDTFAYDLKLSILGGFINIPLGGIIHANGFDPSSLIDTLIGYITSGPGKDVVDTIVNTLTQLSNQYPNGQHVDIDLVQTQLFLLNASNGLLTKLTTAIDTLKNIIKNNDPIQDSAVEQLYVDLGGNPVGPNFGIFTLNSPIDMLQKAMIDQTSELGKILNLLFGSTDIDKKLGVSDIISTFNNQWIKNNYENYFDANNNKLGQTYNISMQRNTVSNIETINLKYDFKYTISGTTYHFVVSASDSEDLNVFQGIRNFKFKTITMIN